MQLISYLILLGSFVACTSNEKPTFTSHGEVPTLEIEPLARNTSRLFSGAIDQTVILANPHLKTHFGNWLLDNGHLQLIVPGIPTMPSNLPGAEIVIDMFTRHAPGVWQHSKYLPSVKIEGRNQGPLKLKAIRKVGTKDKHGLRMSYEGKARLLTVFIDLEPSLPLFTLAVSNANQTKKSSVEITMPRYINKNEIGIDTRVSSFIFSKKDSFFSLHPSPSWSRRISSEDIKLESEVLPGASAVLHGLVGLRGAALNPYISQCKRHKITMKACRNSLQTTSNLDIVLEGRRKEGIHIVGENDELLTVLPAQAERRYKVPLFEGSTYRALSSTQSFTSEGKEKLIFQAEPLTSNNQTASIQSQDEDDKFRYIFEDIFYGLTLKAYSKKSLTDIHKKWTLFKDREKGPAVFAFPHFLKTTFPHAKLELQCNHHGSQLSELILLSKGADVDSIDIDSCESQSKQDKYLALYGALQAIKRQPIKLRHSASAMSSEQSPHAPLEFFYRLKSRLPKKFRVAVKLKRLPINSYFVKAVDQSGKRLGTSILQQTVEGYFSGDLDFSRLSSSKWFRLELVRKDRAGITRIVSSEFIKL